MAYSVYVLYSNKLKSFYKGMSSDLQTIMKFHNEGNENSIPKGAPWTLVWATEKPSQKEAEKLEKKIKNLSTERLQRFMIKYNSDLKIELREIWFEV